MQRHCFHDGVPVVFGDQDRIAGLAGNRDRAMTGVDFVQQVVELVLGRLSL